MNATYTYQTDAVSGEIEAESLQDALDILDSLENVTDCLDDGAWAWVQADDGERAYIGRENMG